MLGMSDRELSQFKQNVLDEISDDAQLRTGDWDFSVSVPGERSQVATINPTRPLAFLPHEMDLAVLAREEYTANGGSPETFGLTHGLLDSGATPTDIVVYQAGSRVEPASVDYNNDTFSLSTNADESIVAFYAAGRQATFEIEKVAPNGVSQVMDDEDLQMVHLRDHEEDPLTMSTSRFFGPLLPLDWELNVYVDAPYPATLAQDVDGDGKFEPLPNALFEVDIRRGTSEIDGLDRLCRWFASQKA